MPDKVIDIPGAGPIAFPETMSDAQINAAATRLYQQANPGAKQPPVKTWVNTATNWLPMAGGVAGGVIGGIGGTVAGMGVGGVPGAIGGATLGGAAGEAARQLIERARGQTAPGSATEAAQAIGTQGAIQGGSEALGAGAAAVMKPAAEVLMQSAVKPGLKAAVAAVRTGKIPPVVQTLLDEGITVSSRGVEKLNSIISATNDEIQQAIQGVAGNINPFKVTGRMSETAKRFATQVNPVSDLQALGKVGNEFLAEHPDITIQEAQALKTGTYRQLAGKYGELSSAEVEGQKALARGLKEEIQSEVQRAGGPDISAPNLREGAAIQARDAVAKRVALAANRDPMGLASLAVSHPLTFLTVMADRSPAFKSFLARGLYSTAGAAAKVNPQLVRAAVQLVASSPDEGP